jgi:uncharacterized protein YebE (UPF0316 family)
VSWTGVSMALLAVLSVGLWTLRVALAARGRRLVGAVVAAVEAIVFALVFSTLMSDLGSWDRIAGYGAGVAAGTVIGLVVNDRLNPGATLVEAVVDGNGGALQEALHAHGWPATAMSATGVGGPATVVFLGVRSDLVTEVLEVVRSVAPDAYWTTRPATALHQPRSRLDSMTV